MTPISHNSEGLQVLDVIAELEAHHEPFDRTNIESVCIRDGRVMLNPCAGSQLDELKGRIAGAKRDLRTLESRIENRRKELAGLCRREKSVLAALKRVRKAARTAFKRHKARNIL